MCSCRGGESCLRLLPLPRLCLSASDYLCGFEASRHMIAPRHERCRSAFGALALVPALASPETAAAQQVRAGLLTCDVSAGVGSSLHRRRCPAYSRRIDPTSCVRTMTARSPSMGLILGVVLMPRALRVRAGNASRARLVEASRHRPDQGRVQALETHLRQRGTDSPRPAAARCRLKLRA